MNTKSFQSFTQMLEYIVKYFKWVVIFSACLMALSGVYRVDANEVAVVLRFGRLLGDTYEKQVKNPGLHFAFPFFIDEVVKIPVETVHELEIITHFGAEGGVISTNLEENGYLLTGDNNIVLIRFVVKYQINNAAQYAIYSNNVDKMIDGALSAELTSVVAYMDIDSVLTERRMEILTTIAQNSQELLDKMNCGVLLLSIELTGLTPPAETIVHFEEVRNAAVTKETNVQQALEAAQTLILNAQAESSALKQTAITNQNLKLTKVRGEMAEFNGLYEQYVNNPEIILTGNFRERISRIIAKTGGSIIISDNDEPPVIILP